MIFVTVGMQLGFDRLIRAMDDLAPTLDMPVIAQIGNGDFSPRNMEARRRIAPGEFDELVGKARVVVSHAGIGTVLAAQRSGTPLVLVPRQAKLGEHRNDHQLATAKSLGNRPGILVAMTETELPHKLAEALSLGPWSAEQSASVRDLHAAITRFIETGRI